MNNLIYNLLIDIPIIHENKIIYDLPFFVGIDTKVLFNPKKFDNLYGILPFKKDKGVIFHYEKGVLKNACILEKGKFKPFNCYGMKKLGFLDYPPLDVQQMLKLQINEVNDNEDIFKLWLELNEEDFHEYDYLNESKFRMILLSEDILFSGKANTITTSQYRIPNCGIVKEDHFKKYFDFYNRNFNEIRKQEQILLF